MAENDVLLANAFALIGLPIGVVDNARDGVYRNVPPICIQWNENYAHLYMAVQALRREIYGDDE